VAEAAAEVVADVAVGVPPGWRAIPAFELQIQLRKLLTHGRTLGDISKTWIWRIFSVT